MQSHHIKSTTTTSQAKHKKTTDHSVRKYFLIVYSTLSNSASDASHPFLVLQFCFHKRIIAPSRKDKRQYNCALKRQYNCALIYILYSSQTTQGKVVLNHRHVESVKRTQKFSPARQLHLAVKNNLPLYVAYHRNLFVY